MYYLLVPLFVCVTIVPEYSSGYTSRYR